jgi:ABC-type bacteriocin/lantibiotic exporter with double-glycine peptidase domain
LTRYRTALANEPQLLLLDEATGDLDTRTTVLQAISAMIINHRQLQSGRHRQFFKSSFFNASTSTATITIYIRLKL